MTSLARDATNLRDLVSRIASEITNVNKEVSSAEAAAGRAREVRRGRRVRRAGRWDADATRGERGSARTEVY